MTFMSQSGTSTSIAVLGNLSKARADYLLCSLLACSHAGAHPGTVKPAIWGSLVLSSELNVDINLFITAIREVGCSVKSIASMKISGNGCSKESIR